MAKVILIGGQKGGSGKTTITSFIANFIANNSKLRSLVIDADDLQQSLLSKRQQEIKSGFYTEDKAPYNLIGSLSSEVPKLLETYDDVYDIIMVDLPGNLKQKGVLSTYVLANYIMMPIKGDFANTDSLVKFISLYNEKIKPKQDELGIDCKLAAFLNNVNPRGIEVRELLNERESYKDKIHIFENIIPHSEVTFGREFNTFEEYQNASDPKKYDQFINEFFEFIK